MSDYWRPIPLGDVARIGDAYPIADGSVRFTMVERLRRDAPAEVMSATEVPAQVMERLTAPRPPICSLDLARPNIMAVVNVTPDSFSDGGDWADAPDAIGKIEAMAQAGDILDIGGESTRPGADYVPVEEEIARVVPVIEAIRMAGLSTPISVDTRKSQVLAAAVAAGADMFNDVSALSHDPDSARVAAELAVPMCLMHAQGDPKTMQASPQYDDVLLDVYDYLDDRIGEAERHGIARSRIIVDPGIGFGKTVAHNLALLRRISLFHGLGCAVLLGVSRKGFIGAIGEEPVAKLRFPGSMTVALDAVRQGVQIIRVHDVAETAQALRLSAAISSD